MANAWEELRPGEGRSLLEAAGRDHTNGAPEDWDPTGEYPVPAAGWRTESGLSSASLADVQKPVNGNAVDQEKESFSKDIAALMLHVDDGKPASVRDGISEEPNLNEQ